MTQDSSFLHPFSSHRQHARNDGSLGDKREDRQNCSVL